ncbi:MAG: RimK family alpha-L-glutamate ligase [Ardenticatenaceae bacterium]|nr:RimK family alpha-L-glutamate ligase [Ardenticatenaceae bacterium]MCB9446356.1 RimK family alpha-L-glutamate ligase [Ardenticatenaceae bacterium]
MKIGILSRNPNLYSTRRLIEAAQKRDHDVRVIDTLGVAIEIGMPDRVDTGIKVVESLPHRRRAWGMWSEAASLLPQVDAIIPRIGASITYYGLTVVRQFESYGVITTAASQAIAQSRDKLHSLQIMQQAGLPIPKTAVIVKPEALYSAIQAVGPPPVVVKLIQGTQGRGVILARNWQTTAAVLEKLRAYNKQALVQEYVAEAEGRDTRIIVVGDRCVAAMTRIAAEGEFRANLHRGGTAVPVTLDAETERLALLAARSHGLSVAGVDLIQSERGPLLLEVNSSPGIEGIEAVTGLDVAGVMIEFLEKELEKKQNDLVEIAPATGS